MALQVGELFATLKLDDSKFNEGMDRTKKSFGAMSGSLASMATGLVAAAGAGLAGVAMSAENLQQSLGTLQKQTGATSEEMEGMEQSLIDIYASNYGESFDDIAQSMANVKRSTGLAGDELESMTKSALMLRDTFEYEVNETTRTADTMMRQFGITGKEAMTLIAQGAQQGLDKHDDMLDTFNEYSVYFKQMGFDAEGMFNILAEGAENGAFNMDKVGDAIKEMGIRVKDESKASKEAFEGLGFNADKLAQQFAQGGESAQQAFTKVMGALSKVEDPVKRNAIGVGLMGTQFEDLEHKAILALGNVEEKANKNADTLEKMNQVKFDSLGEAFKGVGRQVVAGLVVPISEKLLPQMNRLANWISTNLPIIRKTAEQTFGVIVGWITETANFFSDLSNSTGENGKLIRSTFKMMEKEIDAAMENIKNIVSGVTELLSVLWNAFGDEIMAIWSTTWKMSVAILKSITGILSGALETLIGLFTGDWSRMADGLKGIWSNLWDGIIAILSGSHSLVLTAFSGIYDSLYKWFYGLMKDAKGWGADVISGFVDGISGMARRAINKAKEVANNIADGVKNVLGINSPSKVFMEIGQFTGEGLAVGMDKMVKRVKDSADGLVHTATPKMQAIQADVMPQVAKGSGAGGALSINITGDNHFNDSADIDYFVDRLGEMSRSNARMKGLK